MNRLLVTCLSLWFATSAAAQQKYALRPNIEKGQSWTFDQTQDSSSDNQALFNGQPQPYSLKTHQHRAGKVEVLAAQGGLPTSMRITFDKTSEGTSEFNGKAQVSPYIYAGATVKIARGADGRISDDFAGTAAVDTSAELHEILESDAVFAPREPVAINQEWTADPSIVTRWLQLQGPKDRGSMTLQLISVKDIAGRQTAELKVSLACIKEQQGLLVQLVTQGTAMIDLATGHAVQVKSSGTLETSGSQEGPGPDGRQVQYQVSGKGAITIGSTSAFDSTGAVSPRGSVPENPLAPNTPSAPANNPLAAASSPAGVYSNGKLTVTLLDGRDGLAGMIKLGDQIFPLSARRNPYNIEGTFQAGANKFPFTATVDENGMTLVTGDTTYKLAVAASSPLTTPANPLDPSK